jgi:hypothetical protein
VGAGGAFLLVPQLIVAWGVPIRVTIRQLAGRSRRCRPVAGFAGKLITGQIPVGARRCW